MKGHEKYIKRCLELAKNGLGTTYPNPLVGCVIVYDTKIIGEGWHRQAGRPHAEVHAINSVDDPARLKEATLYVNLEPCSHYGQTPPCADLIIAKKIDKVVIGTLDPNPKVAGQGMQKLIAAGITCRTGVLENECEYLNRRFFMAQRHHRPYVILKWAQTQDGFIAPQHQAPGKPTWITNARAKQLVHKWRSEEQAILVGKNTVLNDDPQLNTRLWKGPNPVRAVIDRHLESFSSKAPLHLYDQTSKTIVITEQNRDNKKNIIFEPIDFNRETGRQILAVLHRHNIQSVIVEGGQLTLQHFIDFDLWDEARVFTGRSYFGAGIYAPLFNAIPEKNEQIEGDCLQTYRNRSAK